MKIIKRPSSYFKFEEEFRKKYWEVYNNDLKEFIETNKVRPTWFKKLQLQYLANKKTLKKLKLTGKKTVE